MEVQLKVLVGGNKGQSIKISGPKFFIGRAEDCQLRPGSDLISRHHCVLMIEGHEVMVRDFGSKNGTYINGERLSGEMQLQHGDQMKVGPLEFELSIQESLVGAKRPAVHSVKEAAARTAESGIHKDIDVGEWLLPGVPKEVGDTREFNRNDTTELEMMQNTVVSKPAAQPANDDTQISTPVPKPEAVAPEPPPKDKGKKILGKTTIKAKPNDEDSHSAAADALKRLRRR